LPRLSDPLFRLPDIVQRAQEGVERAGGAGTTQS